MEGPGLSILVEKSIKTGVGTRAGIGTDVFMIFYGFWPPFRAPKSIKNDVENEQELGDGKKVKKERKGDFPGGAGDVFGGHGSKNSKIPKRIRTEPNYKISNTPEPAEAGGGGS